MSVDSGAVRRLDRSLPYLGAALAYVVGAVHLFHPEKGLRELALYVGTGNLQLLAFDPRPLLFTVVGLAILLGPQTAMLPRYRRTVLVGGIVVTAGLFLGYFGWHFTGHASFLPAREPTPHAVDPLSSAIQHLATYPLARVSKLSELLLLAVLVYLYRRDESGAAGDDAPA